MWEGGYTAKSLLCTFKSGNLLVVFYNSIIHGEVNVGSFNMSLHCQPTALVGAIALALGTTSSVFANEQKVAKASLDTIVVTATRSAENIENVPARISIIEPAILEQSSITSLPELLKNDASINMVQAGGIGQQSSIFLRGTESDHTLVLRDGVRLNTATSNAASLAFIDTTDIKQVEVLKGPASVLYGSDAIGGVVQIITQAPKKSGGFVTGEIGENKTYKSVVGADLAENGIYTQIRGQRLETDGTIVTDIPNTPKASFDQKGFTTKLGIDKAQYNASIEYSENQGSSQYDDYGAQRSHNFENKLFTAKSALKLNDQWELNARYSKFEDNLVQNDLTDIYNWVQDEITGDWNSTYVGSEIDYTLNERQEYDLNARWKLTPHQNILIGGTINKSDVNSLSYGTEYNTSLDSNGYYVQHQFNNDKLNTQLGIRLEDNKQFGEHTVGQAALRYKLTSDTSVYTNIGTAFRAPSANDLYSSSGNPNLEPEESISYEIGLNQNYSHGFSSEFSLYRNEIENLITYKAGENQNIKKAILTGFESALKWQADQFYTRLSYSYVQPKDDSDNRDLVRRPRHNATATVGMTNENYGLGLSLNAKSSSKDWDYKHDNPGYMTADFNAHWNLNPSVKLFTNIQNMGDTKFKTSYQDYGNYYLNGGRLASAGVTFKY